MELRISVEYNAANYGDDNRRLQEAKDAFVGFYQTIFYSVVKEVVRYNSDRVPETEVDAVTTAVGKAFASRVFVNSRVSITLHVCIILPMYSIICVHNFKCSQYFVTCMMCIFFNICSIIKFCCLYVCFILKLCAL